jgi:hypothetical protein
LRVRRFDPLLRERKRAAGRAIERRERVGEQLPRGLRDRLPDEEGARILLVAVSAGANSVSIAATCSFVAVVARAARSSPTICTAAQPMATATMSAASTIMRRSSVYP